jgi:hypothetical protein
VAFSLIELIFSIVLISIILTQLVPQNNTSNLNLIANKLILYLKYTRYIAMIDNKYDSNDNYWYKERWTLKFKNCSKKIGGFYYVIFSDKNHKGSPNKTECLKDPITNKYLYSNYDCVASQNESKYILLTKEYGVSKIDISCNKTSTLGQIIFSLDGKIYSKQSYIKSDIDKYEIKEPCNIILYDNKQNTKTIVIEPNTGYIHKL